LQQEWYLDGSKSINGEFHNGLYTGHWTWWYSDGSVALEGEFALGNPRDNWIWITPEGDVEESEFPALKWVENRIQVWERAVRQRANQ